MISRVVMLSVALAMSGCVSTKVLGDNQPGEGEGGVTPQAFDALDLLFVIDNTSGGPNPMEVAALLPTMVHALQSGDADNNGEAEFRGVQRLQVAVVTTDMGAPGISGLPDCGDDTGKPFGDDGLFFTGQPGLFVDGHVCATQSAPLALNLPASEDVRAQFDDALSCAVMVPAGGCGYRMPLEAALKATWDRDDANLTFLGGKGHGLSQQAGFVREGALLAIVVITNGDDCSSADVTHLTPPEGLGPDDPMAEVGRGSRCVRYADHLHPIWRYEEAYARLKQGVVSDVFFGVVGGLPIDFAADLRDQRIDAARVLTYKHLLDDPRMQNVPDPDGPPGEGRLMSVCGDATPSSRLVELSRRFEEFSTAASICDPMEVSLGTMTKAIARLVDPATSL